MSARYIVVTDEIEHGCCYEAMIVDTADTSVHSHGQRIAEFNETDVAEKVCAFLNTEK